MSKDIIYREDAIEAIHNYWKGEFSKMPMTDSEYGEVIDGDYNTLLKHNKELSARIKDIPSADRPQGEWIAVDSYSAFGGSEEQWYAHGNPTAYHYCSVCKEQVHLDEFGEEMLTNFCPNCGAKMKGADDE